MTNENCLAGMACPKCESEGPFFIRATAPFRVTDDGAEYDPSFMGSIEWGDSDFCQCDACLFKGKVADFRPTPPATAPSGVDAVNNGIWDALSEILEDPDTIITEELRAQALAAIEAAQICLEGGRIRLEEKETAHT